MIDPKVSTSGIAYPDDLALLKRVYDRICQERGIGAGSAEAADLAAQAMALFNAGVFDEDEINRSLS
ncbi:MULTISPECIES: hypothetical protein [unclassified Mesorhizobium]|uniref:hypothetical protein n=1 Tax=unclassified Mesorhizobium TaxID=325217 RepID=UPI000FCC040E|nr:MULTISPECIES: hypothetical protein [unclassified Mesorhizobium]RUW67350.1 hypothetical protein EOA31_28930 [Mesorhizobium sp. M4B.F.Ca.ET.049.02.1.2]RVD28247.1 hypothetical protein EN738_10820 [Mesorhizobium sp. M4B.F.Ca.ET.017.02.2.1]TGV27607.1 hypothetical protein EN786_05490 [Mesorhizobium sp. M4B.F.Ca.ET.143.01.1.1]